MRYLRMLVVVALAAPLVAGVAAAPAVAAGTCVPPGATVTQVGWAQLALDAEHTAPLTQGAGQRIAVLSTGVDATQTQLRGRVDPGSDTTASGQATTTDCAGAGTQVAGVIAAAKLPDAAFVGLAPAARITAYRVVGQNGAADPADLAAAVTHAIGAGVTVICVPVAAYSDDDALRGAVADALHAGIPVVAAVGDGGSQGNPTPYPASYPGVIAVTALNEAGQVAPSAGMGDYVTLGAPGVNVTTIQAGGGLLSAGGSGVAAGAVAGAVALVRSRYPRLTPEQVARRLTADATPTTAYLPDPKLAGMVNPYRALTEDPADASPSPVAGYQPPPPDQVRLAQARVQDRALLALGATVVLVLVATLLAVFSPRGRRRSWRPARAPDPAPEPPSTEATPPIQLFDDYQPEHSPDHSPARR